MKFSVLSFLAVTFLGMPAAMSFNHEESQKNLFDRTRRNLGDRHQDLKIIEIITLSIHPSSIRSLRGTPSKFIVNRIQAPGVESKMQTLKDKVANKQDDNFSKEMERALNSDSESSSSDEDDISAYSFSDTRWTRGDPDRILSPKGTEYTTWEWDKTELPPSDGTMSQEELFEATQRTIRKSFQQWEDIECSVLKFDEVGQDLVQDIGLREEELAECGQDEGGFFAEADLVIGGWVDWIDDNCRKSQPPETFVLIITYSFGSDFDGDGFNNTGFAEVYFNSKFNWAFDDATDNFITDTTTQIFDVQTVVMQSIGVMLGIQLIEEEPLVDEDGNQFYEEDSLLYNDYYRIFEEPTERDKAAFCFLYENY